IDLMRGIVAKEGVEIEDEALVMLARAAEGSARDSLSLLDQAIAHASGKVEATAVRSMLGLADRALIIDLFGELMRGEIAGALERLKVLYDVGADPAVVLEDVAAFTHLVTRLKLAPEAADDDSLTEEEKTRGLEFASKLSLKVLARTWQMLLKGIEETRAAARPLAAADMVLVRIAYAADLPTPDEALRAIRDGAPMPAGAPPSSPPPSSSAGSEPRARLASVGGAPSAASAPASRPAPVAAPAADAQPAIRLATFDDLVALASEKRDLKWKHALEHYVRIERFEDGRIELALTEDAPGTLAGDLSRQLETWTGRRWMVAVAREAGAQTIAEARRAARDQLVDDARSDPVVAAVLARFPGAEIVDVRVRGGEGDAALSDGSDVVAVADEDLDD
ncbi:MAG: DNA polymerase III subunit gamma/tau, partial [Bauldia sp.]|nr:DNA polymerase III subunit gamma/tau [Bauldia sp.]